MKNNLKKRVIRDLAFIILGILFLIISIIKAFNTDSIKSNKENKNITTIKEKR